MVKRVDGHIGHPDRTLKQSLRRFNYVMEYHGITRRHLGITSHGLRHQRLNDLYEEIAGVPSPVRQANADSSMETQHVDPMRIDLARARVSQRLVIPASVLPVRTQGRLEASRNPHWTGARKG